MIRSGKLLFLLPLTLSMMIAISAGAIQIEAGNTILTLDEVLDRLDSQNGISSRSDLPGDTPVIFPGEPSQLGAKSISAALVMSGLALRPDGEVVQPHALSERTRAERRNIPHFAATPRSVDSIDSGGLVLFGRVYEPPFRVDVRRGEVLINEVLVYPSPGASARPPSPGSREIFNHSELERAGAAFAETKNRGEAQSAQANLAETMLARPEIVSARWRDENNLELRHEDGSIEMITIGDEGREADEDPLSREDEALEELAAGLRRVLEQNYTVLAGATYLLTLTHANAFSFRQRIEEVRNSPESDLMKLARLQAWTGQRNAAADLLYNQ